MGRRFDCRPRTLWFEPRINFRPRVNQISSPGKRVENHRTIAEAYLRALEFDLADVAAIDAWVDGVILAEPEPAPAFIEASAAKCKPDTLMTALRDIPGEANAAARRRIVIGIMAETLRRDPEAIKRIVRALYQMALDGDAPNQEAESEMWSFDDELDLAGQGIYGSTEDVRRDLVRFLARHGQGI